MKIETLHKSKMKYYIIGSVLILGILGIFIIKNTFSKFRNTQSINIVNGTIHYTLGDINIIAIRIKEGDSYKEVESVPESGYTFNSSESYCKSGGEIQEVEIGYDIETKTFTVAPYTSGKMKCYLYFDPKPITIPEIVATLNAKTTTPDFSKTATTDEGVYAVSDGMYGGTSYYWRGAVTNNYVKFGGFCWRIVRINGDGSMRLIYDGATCHANGTKTAESIALSMQAYNASNDKSYYVGWSYGTTQHGTGTDSNAKTKVEDWYNTVLASYDAKIADGKYCNDRSVGSGTWSASGSIFYYAAEERLDTNKTPSLSCTNTSDVFTTKIGLITADEVAFAGGVYGTSNTSYYLNNGQNYWTMTPFYWDGDENVSVFVMYLEGALNNNFLWLDIENGLRPVINLKVDTTFKAGGNGTIDTPYEVI